MKTQANAEGTSFFGATINATVSQLVEALGPADYSDNGGGGKTNFDWWRKTQGGIVFTVYDYKEYRELRANEVVNWHIGGFDKASTEQAKLELSMAIALAASKAGVAK